MNLSGKDIALFSVTLAVLGGSLYANWNWELVWSACGLLLLAYAIFIKNAFSLAYTGIALLAPLSVKIALPFADLYLPSEFLTASLALSVAAVLLLSKQGGLLLKNPLPALWLLTFVPGIIASELPQTSVKFFALNALFVTAFYYGGLLLAARGNAFPWTAFLTGLVPVGLWGLYQFSRYNFNPITISGIFKPFFYSHTMFGAVAAFMAAVALSKARTQRWWLLAALVATVAVGFSTSRAALWSLVFMGGLFALSALPKALRVAVPALAVAGFFGLGGWVKLDEAFTYNSYESHDPQASLVEQSMSVTNVQSDASNIERLNRWTSALAMFNERPFTGFGPGTYQFTYIPFQDKRLENRLTVTNPNSPPPGSGGSAHSELLLQLSENGIWSPLIFLLMWVRWFYFGWFNRPNLAAVLPVFFGLSTYFFHMQFNNFLNQSVFAFLFWGAAAYLDYKIRSQRDELLR